MDTATGTTNITVGAATRIIIITIETGGITGTTEITEEDVS